jgi:hypothetical protein
VYTQNANVEIRATAVEDLTAVSSVNAVNNTTLAVTTGVFGSGTWALDLAPGYTYTVHAKNNLDLDATSTVTVTADTTPPSMSSFGTISGTGPYTLTDATFSESGSGIAAVDSTGGTVTYTVGPIKAKVTGLAGSASYKITATDNVGNIGGRYFYLKSDNALPAIYANVPSSWTVSGSGPYALAGMAANNNTWAINDGASDVKTGSGWTDAVSGLDAGTYTLKLTDWEATPNTLTIPFVISATGKVSSVSLLGSTTISERLPADIVTATIRKDSFERARSASKTNLPVWYSEAGSIASSAKTERTGTASVTANKGVVQNLATPALADKKLSVEALHAAALSGMKATNGLTPRASEDIAKTVQENETENFGDAIVMSAPEGSPAFVAYARGLAALRDVRNGSVAAKVDRASFTISDGEKPVTVWEKLLTFFGIEKRIRGQGFAMN